MIKAIHHVGIVVIDLDVSLHFYRDILDLEVSGRFYDKIEESEIVFLNVGEEVIELISPKNIKVNLIYRKWERRDVGGVEHIALTVDDLDKMHEKLLKRGIKCLMKPTIYQNIRYAYYQAPDGVILELVQEIEKKKGKRKISA